MIYKYLCIKIKWQSKLFVYSFFLLLDITKSLKKTSEYRNRLIDRSSEKKKTRFPKNRQGLK